MALREHHIYYHGPAAPSIPVQHLKRSRQPGALDYEADDMSSVSYRLMHNTFTTLQSPQVRGLLQRHQMRVRDELYRGFVEQQRAIHRLQFERQQDFAALVEMKRERRRIARDLRWWEKRIEDNEAQLRHRKRKGRQIENRLAVQLIGQRENGEGEDGEAEVREEELELLPAIDPLPSKARSTSSSNVTPSSTLRTNFTPALPPIKEGTVVNRELSSERAAAPPVSAEISTPSRNQLLTLTPTCNLQLPPLNDTSSAFTTITITSVASREEMVFTPDATTRTETNRSSCTPPPFVYVDRAEAEVLVQKKLAAERPSPHELFVTRHQKWRPADHLRVDPRAVLHELEATGAASLGSKAQPLAASQQKQLQIRAEKCERPPVGLLATRTNERTLPPAVLEGTPLTANAALEQRGGIGRGKRGGTLNEGRGGSGRLQKRRMQKGRLEYGVGTRSETPLYSLLRRQRAEESARNAQVRRFCSMIDELRVEEEQIKTSNK